MKHWHSNEAQSLPSASSGAMTLLLPEFLTRPEVSGTPGKAVCYLGTFTVSRSITLTGALPTDLSIRVHFPHFSHTCIAHCRSQTPSLFLEGKIWYLKLGHTSNHRNQEKSYSTLLDEQQRNSNTQWGGTNS